MHACRSFPGIISPNVNYSVLIKVTFLSYETFLSCYPEKIYMIESTIRCLTFFKGRTVKVHALKTALQEHLERKKPSFAKKKPVWPKQLSLIQVSSLQASLDFKFLWRDINLGSSNCGSYLTWEHTTPCGRCVSTSAVFWLYSYIIAALIRAERHCIALERVLFQFRILLQILKSNYLLLHLFLRIFATTFE